MPVTLAQLATNRTPVTVAFENGLELRIEYFPQRLTAQMLADFAALDGIDSRPPSERLALVTGVTDTLLMLLASWDLVESIGEDGRATGPATPITRETLAGLGLGIEWAILVGIMASGSGSAGEASAPEGNGSASKPRSGAIS